MEVYKMKEIKTRRVFTREFKKESVEYLLNSDKTASEIAAGLGIRSELLYRWKGEYLNNREHSFPGAGHMKNPEEEKVRDLERELRSIKEERDILKKALAIFSKTPR
jgi:transposase